jgi:penicillin-binding protein 1A
VYTAAIDSGIPPTATVDDSPISYPMGDGTRWSPMDDDFRFLGPITLRYALAQSRNVVAVRLAQQIGVDRVIEYAHRMGIKENLEPNLSLALGSSVVSPLEQASGYSTLANQGIHIDPTAIRLVKDPLGTALVDNRFPQETEVVSAGTAYIMTSMLEGVIKEGSGYPNAELGRPAAGKTGTTSDFRDAWFVGYTPDLVTAVWLGNDNYARMNESYGGNVPARTWARFMKAALANVPKHDFAYPASELRKLAYCGGGKRYEYFLDGTEPGTTCASAGYDGRRRTAYDTPPVGAEPLPARFARTPLKAVTFLPAHQLALPSDPPDPPEADPTPLVTDTPAPGDTTVDLATAPPDPAATTPAPAPAATASP